MSLFDDLGSTGESVSTRGLLSLDSPMPFGKYGPKGLKYTVRELLDENPGYILYCFENFDKPPRLDDEAYRYFEKRLEEQAEMRRTSKKGPDYGQY